MTGETKPGRGNFVIISFIKFTTDEKHSTHNMIKKTDTVNTGFKGVGIGKINIF